MHVSTTIQLTSILLGATIDPKDQKPREITRRFDKIRKKGLWRIDPEWWGCLVEQAIEGLRMDVAPDCVQPPRHFPLPTIHLYRKKRKDRDLVEYFEAMRAGTRLTFEFALLTRIPAMQARLGKKPPTLEDMRQILDYIGLYMSISPYGANYGNGRFSVLSLEQKNPEMPEHLST